MVDFTAKKHILTANWCKNIFWCKVFFNRYSHFPYIITPKLIKKSKKNPYYSVRNSKFHGGIP